MQCASVVCLYFCLLAHTLFIIAQMLYASKCVFACECVFGSVCTAILNSCLNSCVFISPYGYVCVCVYVLYSVMNAFPAPCLAPEALVCRII